MSGKGNTPSNLNLASALYYENYAYAPSLASIPAQAQDEGINRNMSTKKVCAKSMKSRSRYGKYTAVATSAPGSSSSSSPPPFSVARRQAIRRKFLPPVPLKSAELVLIHGQQQATKTSNESGPGQQAAKPHVEVRDSFI
ncbi:hypothetical protein Ocin01_07777 [Orchesella cincta]|uniref:Uncharacterized protein n=1 Tax=Orchesella cincta TaxID=48709 RepID=A0A1D2N0R5_ORCCI|nr:hypothetical protein Ocin01_07777 [Orchesella cincta]